MNGIDACTSSPFTDRALKLGRYAEPETAAARKHRLARVRRVDLILLGLPYEEIHTPERKRLHDR